MELVSWASPERYQHTCWSSRLGVYNRPTEGTFVSILNLCPFKLSPFILQSLNHLCPLYAGPSKHSISVFFHWLSIGCVHATSMPTGERNIGCKSTKRGFGRLRRHLMSNCLIITRVSLLQKLHEDGWIWRKQILSIGLELGLNLVQIVNQLTTT